MDPVYRALKLGAPLSVEASSTRVNAETFPLGSMVTYHFPARGPEIQAHNPHVKGLSGVGAGGIAMPPLKLVWYDGGLRPPRPAGLDDEQVMGDNGRLLIGDRGFMLGNRIYPAERAREVAQIPRTLPRVAGHYKDWVDACKAGRQSGADFAWAGPLAEGVLLGNVPLRVQLREKLTRYRLPTSLSGGSIVPAGRYEEGPPTPARPVRRGLNTADPVSRKVRGSAANRRN
jgi:hypothetical protein